MSVSYVTSLIMEGSSLPSSLPIPLDKIDLKIMNMLSADCRTPFRNMSSTIGITPNAVKTRVNKMLAKGLIRNFVVRVNPSIFGYQKLCILIVRHINRALKEDGSVNLTINL